LRGQFGVVLQDPILFPGTVFDNIAYGRADATAEDVRAAARDATAASFIDALPAGYDTQVGDEGGLLSGGQRQRVAIARALLGSPRMLVMDEPTTYLDDASIATLVHKLAELPNAPTVIIVTHDLDLAARADRLVHLRDGQTVRVERGDRARAGAA
jgi:ABC-type multidrug transport system fused ATPase/permease subunit